MTKCEYGSWSAADFAGTLLGLSPSVDCDEADVGYLAEDLKQDKTYDSFIEAFREFLLDESIDFAQKAELYFQEEFWSSAKCWDYCNWLWSLLAPDQPWPLEGMPRPAEPIAKSGEFKPQ